MSLVDCRVHTASRSTASVTGQLRLLVSTSTQIVGAVVDDNGALSPTDLASSVRVITYAEYGSLTPRTLSGPINLMSLSVTVVLTLPWSSVLKLPMSPTWRSSSSGAPWVVPKGLTVGGYGKVFSQPSHLFCNGIESDRECRSMTVS